MYLIKPTFLVKYIRKCELNFWFSLFYTSNKDQVKGMYLIILTIAVLCTYLSMWLDQKEYYATRYSIESMKLLAVLFYQFFQTRILVTNGVGFLSSADKIVFIKDGELSAFAPLHDMMKIREFTAFHEDLQRKPNVKEEILFDLFAAENTTKEQEDSLIKSDEDGIELKIRPPLGRNIRKSSAEHLEKAESTKLIEDEKTESGKVSWKVYATLLKYASYKGVVVAFLTNAVYTAFVLAANIWLSLWSEETQKEILEGVSDKNKRDLRLGIYVLFNVLQGMA